MKTFFAKFSSRSYFLLSLFIITTHQLIYQPYIGPTISNYGDFAMFMEHWLVGKIWFNKNFLQVPWFTPTHCLAFPFYANPQNLYYSISQIFFIIFNPEIALRLYFLFLSLIAFFGCYIFLNNSLKYNIQISILGSTLFLFNGFFNERFLAAHYGVVTYVFLPFYLHCICQTLRFNFKQNKFYLYLSLSSLILAQIIYSGSAALTPHIFLSTLLSIVVLLYYKFSNRILINYTLSLLLFFLLASSKIAAGFFLLEQYPRDYLNPIISNNVFFILKTIFLNIFIYPSSENYLMLPDNRQSFSHELNYFLTIIPIIIIALFLKQNLNLFKFKEIKDRKFLSSTVIIFLIFPIIITHNNITVELLSNIPIFKNLWVNSRFYIIYQMPIILFTCFCLSKTKFKKKNIFITCLVVLACVHLYFYPKKHHQRLDFYVENSKMLNEISKQDYKIENIFFIAKENDYKTKFKNNQYITDSKDFLYLYLDTQLLNRGTLYDCYEPVLGYGHEKRSNDTKLIWPLGIDVKKIKDIQVIVSNPYWEFDNVLNFNNPICQIFPDENNCKKGQNFKSNEKRKLNNLLSFKPIRFKKNKLQENFDFLSISSFLTILIFFLLLILRWLYMRRKL